MSEVVLVLWWVNDNLGFHKEFIGLLCMPSIEASSLVFIVKESLLCLNLTLAKAQRQHYDGSSNMSGLRNGVSKQIQDEELRAIYTHCYRHSSNLATRPQNHQVGEIPTRKERVSFIVYKMKWHQVHVVLVPFALSDGPCRPNAEYHSELFCPWRALGTGS